MKCSRKKRIGDGGSDGTGKKGARRGQTGAGQDAQASGRARRGARTKRAPRGALDRAMAGYAGLEPATSDVTGRRSNRLS